ncbi:MAG: dihydropteroate synthase [Deltaproteobacteria bacterium]|jgi:dihydropteroate synthase|nr:dihydropteroate synthase [Deltaproteobacteria bacterium]
MTAPRTLEWFHPSGKAFSLDFTRPLIMAILNLTPDSFSDGGRFFEPEKALAEAEKHISDGADILDIGAETTRPGSLPISQEEEWNRLFPVLTALSDFKNCPPISIDTYKATTAQKAIDLGASMINDVFAGRGDPKMFEVASLNKVPLVLMHMQGDPRTMQQNPFYLDVVSEVRDFLLMRAKAAEAQGVDPSLIILDPGIGFGKNRDHNLSILKRFREVIPEGYHSLMALSRKAFLGQILEGVPPMERDFASAVASAFSVINGAQMVRVHNVSPTREALLVASEVLNAK